jgi:hypothetical protein
MMTHPLVAARRAARLRSSGLPVADLTCGIGGDLAAIAAAGAQAIGLDRDPVAALLARANVPSASLLVGDARRPPLTVAAMAVLIDPSRRSGITRRFDPGAFSPTWAEAVAVAGQAALGVVKGPPGIDLAHVPPAGEVEFVQLGKGLREAAIWLGSGVQPGLRRAVLLPGGATLTSHDPESDAETSAPLAVIIDPESCVTRAGLVRQLAATLGARMLDPQVAYLTAPAPAPAEHAMADAFEVLDVLHFSVGRLRARLRERRWRPDQIRRRAFPIEPDELRRLLGKLDGEPVTLICTTLAGERTVFVTREIRSSTEMQASP